MALEPICRNNCTSKGCTSRAALSALSAHRKITRSMHSARKSHLGRQALFHIQKVLHARTVNAPLSAMPPSAPLCRYMAHACAPTRAPAHICPLLFFRFATCRSLLILRSLQSATMITETSDFPQAESFPSKSGCWCQMPAATAAAARSHPVLH